MSALLDGFINGIQHIILLVMLLYFIGMLGLYLFQRRIIYMPYIPFGSKVNILEPYQYGFIAKDEKNENGYEVVHLETKDRVHLIAYWIPLKSLLPLDPVHTSNQNVSSSNTGENFNENHTPTLMFFHANAGNLGHRLPIVRSLIETLRCNVYILSYRGYASCTGTPSEDGIKMDAETAMDDILKRKKTGSIPNESQIILYGQSLGCAVALYIGSKYTNEISAIMIENPFISIPSLIPNFIPIYRYFPFLCTEIWSNKTWMKNILEYETKQNTKVAQNTFQYSIPMLILSGLNDEVIPSQQPKTLFDLILYHYPQENVNNDVDQAKKGVIVSKLDRSKKWFVTFEHGYHNDTCIQNGYYENIRAFFSGCVKNMN